MASFSDFLYYLKIFLVSWNFLHISGIVTIGHSRIFDKKSTIKILWALQFVKTHNCGEFKIAIKFL